MKSQSKDKSANEAAPPSKDFLGIEITLPGDSDALKQIQLMDKQGNLVQPSKVDYEAKIKSEQTTGKLTMSEAHGIDQSR